MDSSDIIFITSKGIDAGEIPHKLMESVNMEWTNMLTILNNCSKSVVLTVYWVNGLILNGVIDTFSETDNCLNEGDPDYKEYYMCVLKITDIVQLPKQDTLFNEKVGNLIELSVLNRPIKIEEKNKGVNWQE